MSIEKKVAKFSSSLKANVDGTMSKRDFLKLGAALGIASLLGHSLPNKTKAGDKELDLPVSPPKQRLDLNIDPFYEGAENLHPEIPQPPQPHHPRLYEETIYTPEQSLVMVIDTSSSMNLETSTYTSLDGRPVFGGSRLDRAKVELTKLITGLPEHYLFNMVEFNCDWWKWENEMQQATERNKARAIGWVYELWPMGLTGTQAAVAEALRLEPNNVLALISDGAPNCNPPAPPVSTHLSLIQAANQRRKPIHCFGIGAYGEFEQFLRDIAATSGGLYRKVE